MKILGQICVEIDSLMPSNGFGAQLNRNHASLGPLTANGTNKLASATTLSTMPVESANRYARQTIFSAVLDRCTPGNCSPNSLHPYVRRKGILPINAMFDPFT